MKKIVLYSTVALSLLSPLEAYTADIDINEDTTVPQNLENEEGSINFISGSHGFDNGSITAQDNISFNGGDVTTEASHITAHQDINFNGGTLNAANSAVNTQNLNINDGQLTITNINTTHEVLINKDLNINGGSATFNGNGTEESHIFDVKENLTITDGSLNINKIGSFDIGESVTINGGATSISDTGVPIWGDEMTISGGNLNVTNSTLATGYGQITIDGGQISLSGTEETHADLVSSAGDLNISGTETRINLNGNAALHSIDTRIDADGNIYAGSTNNLSLNDATITVTGENNMIGAAGNREMNSGTIYIEEGGHLLVADRAILDNPIDTSGDVDFIVPDNLNYHAASLNFNSGDIQLQGTLEGDVTGNGNLNFNSSSAQIIGALDGANVTFNTDHSLSNAVSGTIGNLNSLKTYNSKLTYDKQTGFINTVYIGNGSALNIKNYTVNAGDITFGDNATLALNISGLNAYGNIIADTITIGSDSTLDLTVNNGLLENGQTADFQILTTDNLSGDFANKLAENTRYKINFLDAKTVRISSSTPLSDIISGAGGNKNHIAIGEAWDTVTPDDTNNETTKNIASTLNRLSQTDPNAYVDALTALGPDMSPSIQQAAITTTGQIFNAVGTRLGGSRVEQGRKAMYRNRYHRPSAAVWAHGLYSKAKYDGDTHAKGFDADTKGIVVGAEANFTPSTKIGIGYAHTNTDISGFRRETEIKSHTALLYGEYKPDNWFMNGIVSYSTGDMDETKNVAGIKVTGKSDLEIFGLQIMTGYDIHTPILTLTPETGLRYTHTSLDKYKDSAEQQISMDDLDIVTGILGVKFSQIWLMQNGVVFRPELRLAVTYDLTGDEYTTNVKLVNNAKYKTTTKSLDRMGIELDAGFTAEITPQTELSLSYNGRFRKHYDDNTGFVSAKYKF